MSQVYKGADWAGTKKKYLALASIDSSRAYYITDLASFVISSADMILALTSEASLYNVGAIYMCGDNNSTDYVLGKLYQFTATGWVDVSLTIGQIVNGNVLVLDPQNNLQISEGGTYIIMGDCQALTITATMQVTITILGTLGNLTLPATTGTVLLKSTGYTGTLDLSQTANTVPFVDGSIVGKYQIRCVDVQ